MEFSTTGRTPAPSKRNRKHNTRSKETQDGMDEFVGGLASGCVEVSVMQPTVYFKNASQQGLPVTLRPLLLYRGIGTNLINMSVLTGLQFPLTAMTKKLITGGERPLTAVEQVTSGFVGGLISGVVCSPLELSIITQQRRGGTVLAVLKQLRQAHGARIFYRGLSTACVREGIFTAGYLGLGPLAVDHLRQHYQFGRVQSEVGGAIFAGCIAAGLSHPVDTIKTCMQGDPGRTTFSTITATARRLYCEGGLGAFFRGAEWRIGRTIGSVFIFGKCREALMYYGILDA
ncbi:hypothetical protein PTSG_09396 [Salpingoeca rosetta]|uniref:Uncharacterized protein n=1 Tax=Salpingoeca rosetta (strain ATCC 50818 / BSB-021) TaxID=946362 RepID=F2UMI1_SALR5|nr:uncharacterized protein PTSG_09396 [Salpingoeca rosetta]EGD78330.1 hypothetical protein PTSG_09396 [Salpingoeca rosetta]|eukprot:XP_004989653.1 hypothetical protein PTSG_09396 [Salpingoeca rosetta]